MQSKKLEQVLEECAITAKVRRAENRCEFDAALGGFMAYDFCNKPGYAKVVTRGYSPPEQPDVIACRDHYRVYHGNYIVKVLSLIDVPIVSNNDNQDPGDEG